MFQKKLFKTLHQKKILHDGKPSFQFLTLALNSLREPKTTSQISSLVNFCKVQTKMSGKKPVQPQPPKLPKQKTPTSTNQAKNPGQNQLVPISPSLVANCYVVSIIPRPNYERPIISQPSYSSALASLAPRAFTSYTVDEPFGPIQLQQPSFPLTRKGRSPYVKKPYVQYISYIEPHLIHIKDPLAMAMEVLPSEWHYLPKHPEKNIKFYKNILIQKKSARVENILNRADPTVVLYHKFIITGFISSKEWGRHPFLLKPLAVKTLASPELFYSYYDYIDAFKKVLFYQNKNFDHSWFLMFDKKFSSTIPTWFLKWWEIFESVPQIFPEPFQEALRYFSSRLRSSQHNSQFPSILHLTIRYRIHWISMWSYTICNNLLNREFLLKWWDSFKIDQVISQINKDFPPPFQKTLAQPSQSQSSLDSIQVTGKSSQELKNHANQLLLQSKQLESQQKVSPAFSEASINHDPLLQDSQDLYDGYNLDED